MSSSFSAFSGEDTLEYWAAEVQRGLPLEQVPEKLRARVARRLNRAGDPPAEASADAPEGRKEASAAVVGRSASAAWWRGGLGLALGLALPFLALAVLFWLLGRVPAGAGGSGFVEGRAAV